MIEGTVEGAGLRRLNHVDFVSRPRRHDLVRILFDLIGFVKNEDNAKFPLGFVDTAETTDNVLAGSEVRPDQWEFDRALAKVHGRRELACPFGQHTDFVGGEPQSAKHVGIRFEPLAESETTIARVRDLDAHESVRVAESGAMVFSRQAKLTQSRMCSTRHSFGPTCSHRVHWHSDSNSS